jgi:hypothetical protein
LQDFTATEILSKDNRSPKVYLEDPLSAIDHLRLQTQSTHSIQNHLSYGSNKLMYSDK